MLACVTLITLDLNDSTDSALEPARRGLGELFGPAETAASVVVRPITAIPDWFQSRDSLRDEVDDLEAENAELRSQVRTTDFDRNRLAELEGLTAAAGTLDHALVPARVVGLGPSQSFSRTVTIDAGSDAGLVPDLTVLNDDGLVGRVLRVTRTTATVLLIIDADSTVGGRVGESMEVGFLRGRGAIGDDGRLDLELVDEQRGAGQARHGGHLGERGRGAVRRRRTDRPGDQGLHQPARPVAARRDRAVRGLRGARRRRRRGAVGHQQRPRR